MNKKAYLAGPMTGLPYFNFKAFFEGEERLHLLGYDTVFNPARNDIERYGEFYKECPNGTHEEAALVRPGDPPTYRACLKADLNWILDEADTFALLPGWERSRGVKVEKALAEVLDLEIIEL